MKKRRLWILLVMLCVILPLCASDARGEENSGEAEWTVMFYICGSDLESQYGYATENLKEIVGCFPFFSLYDHTLMPGDEDLVDDTDQCGLDGINLVFETGGCKQWHTDPEEMAIDSSVLQRWHFQFNPEQEGNLTFLVPDGTLPLQSMADQETLEDFVHWSAESYPAKKYALVLWGHGGGSQSGLFVDELFDNDIMPLNELGAALRGSGVYLECVLLDACMMATVETACAIGDSAHWMIASEEVVGGKGTAVGDWLQQLCYIPEMDGEGLGRMICDTTQMKYSREESITEQEILTWSVIDLTRRDQLDAAFDHMFRELCRIYRDEPLRMINMLNTMMDGESYGEGEYSQWDLGEMFFLNGERSWDPALRREMLQTLKEMVVFCVRGPGRSASRGLAFCFATALDCKEMDAYAVNCPSPHYLALLDAISPWTAPDWVYEHAERLPEVDTIPAYRDRVVKFRMPNGVPVFDFVDDGSKNWFEPYVMRYNLYRVEKTGTAICLGSMPISMLYEETEDKFWLSYGPNHPTHWPAIEGVTCAFDVQSLNRTGWNQMWGNVPLMINGEHSYLRCSYSLDDNEFTIHGIWDGYDLNTGMFNRNVHSLAQVAGQEFALVYPVHKDRDTIADDFFKGQYLKMYRSLKMANTALPDGDYFLEYVIYDCFMRPRYLDWVSMRMEGGQASYPGVEEWEGEAELTIPEEYW